MRKIAMLFTIVVFAACAVSATASKLINSSFELEFGPRADQNMWGEYGEAFGEAYQVDAEGENRPGEAVSGQRVLIINIPRNTWNGIWQQVPCEPGATFTFKARYFIGEGDLDADCATFLKVEFFDGMDNKISDLSGQQRGFDTHGRWILDSLEGTAPEGTASIRCIIIAGHNPDGPPINDRIFWDDATLEE